jgi:hypothetical protein
VRQLSADCKKAYDSVRREGLCNVLTQFGISMKLVRLIQVCCSEACSMVRAGKYVSDSFPVTNGLKQEGAVIPICLIVL